MPNLWIVFVTGLFTGGLTCMAVQGGLLASVLARQEESQPSVSRAGSIAAFVCAKLISYAILGALLGYLGSFFQLSIGMQAALMIGAAVFMIGTALSLLDVHPLFRHFVIQPPYALRRFIRTRSKSGENTLSAAALGALTVFIPCGTTQAMMALAVSSQSPLAGALVLAVFTLGTAPLFFLLGYSIDTLKEVLASRFAPVTAVMILAVSAWNINNALVLSASPWAPKKLATAFYCTVTFCSPDASRIPATNTVTVTFKENGYRVDNPYILPGTLIRLNLVNESGGGCIQAFTLPRYNIQRIVPVGSRDSVTFTSPATGGEIGFSCGMGMFSGTLYVVQSG